MLVIQISDFPVAMRLGVFDEERLHPQDVLITLRLTLAESVRPGRSDDLARTVDYGAVMGAVREVLEHQEIKLVETVVDVVGMTIMESFAGIACAHVIVEKTTLPPRIARSARVRVEQTFTRSPEISP